MGFRFSIEHANWLAHILQPVGATPHLEHVFEESETLRRFLSTFEYNFFASRPESRALQSLLHEAIDQIHLGRKSPMAPLLDLQRYFRSTPWVALLLPSGTHLESDELLTDPRLLADLVKIRPSDPGLILQLEEVPRERIALDHVFPAFKVAFAELTRWPGLLVWTPTGEAAFFELSRSPEVIRGRLTWLFSHLATSYGAPDLHLLKQQFGREELPRGTDYSQVRIIHLSDLHLGSQVARRRLDRVQTLIESVVRELGEDAPIVPVITGDLMESPSDDNLGDVRAFMGFLNSLDVEKPIVVIGNHDVREDGWLSPQFQQAVNISSSPVVWMDDYSVGFVCFNSVNGGRLARGWLGEQEMAYVGNAIDERPRNASSFTMIGALHHHPIPVKRPTWYKPSWYERLLGGAFERTEALEDAEPFLAWLTARRVAAVLHGHKHIPRFDLHGDIAVVGCGSTMGKVKTLVKGHTYMSLNVLTIDRGQNLLGCRLRAERILGAGLEGVESHELVLKSTLISPGLTPASTGTRRKRRAF